MLSLGDILFTLLHLAIIGFNLFGWIWPNTRKANLICLAVTAASWFILGIWYGIGYCPITDWQWRIKERLGEHNLPNSFVKYYADKISRSDVSAHVIDVITVVVFFMALGISIYMNFNRKDHNYEEKS
jgi:hypothetical protein